MSENLSLTVDTGEVSVDVFSKSGTKLGAVRFIPADSNLYERFEKVYDFFIEYDLPDNTDDLDLKKINKDISDQFAFLIGNDSCSEIFDKCSPMTLTGNGDLFFEVLLDGIAGIAEKVNDRRMAKKMDKIKKATEKYHK